MTINRIGRIQADSNNRCHHVLLATGFPLARFVCAL
jgi:hypothetical protein